MLPAAAYLLPLLARAQFLRFPCPPGLPCELGGGNSINAFILTVISWLLGIAFGLAVLFLIIGGFMYIMSGGNEEAAEKGKKAVTNAIIGIIIIILSYVIINVIVNLLGGAGAGGAATGAP